MTNEQRLEEARQRGLNALKHFQERQRIEAEKISQLVKEYESSTSDRHQYLILRNALSELTDGRQRFIDQLGYVAIRLAVAWEVAQGE